tara:strand:- start:1384 stop:2022 length:639 start_codon:yes stop_codon:yes gene_type:complete
MFNAQACQDIFVDKVLNKTNGFFVDIGAGTGGLPAHTPGFYSNTYFFETFRNWKGIAIDYDTKWYDSVKNSRNCIVSCVDLLKTNISEHLELLDCPTQIDYLSIDVDDAQLKVFNDFDFDKYRFKVLTLEHNLFQSLQNCTQNRSQEHKEKIAKEHTYYREVLSSHGYKLLWDNVCLENYGPVEDWFVDEETFDKNAHIHRQYANCLETMNI